MGRTTDDENKLNIDQDGESLVGWRRFQVGNQEFSFGHGHLETICR